MESWLGLSSESRALIGVPDSESRMRMQALCCCRRRIITAAECRRRAALPGRAGPGWPTRLAPAAAAHWQAGGAGPGARGRSTGQRLPEPRSRPAGGPAGPGPVSESESNWHCQAGPGSLNRCSETVMPYRAGAAGSDDNSSLRLGRFDSRDSQAQSSESSFKFNFQLEDKSHLQLIIMIHTTSGSESN